MNDSVIISRNESAAIKGVLIFLIVLGHNRNVGSSVFFYLYTFHVYSFFILPYFYPAKIFNKELLYNYVVRFLYPYSLFFIFYALVYVASSTLADISKEASMLEFPYNYIMGYLTGGKKLLSDVLGFQHLWFLPTLLTYMILVSLFKTKCHGIAKGITILLGMVAFVFFVDFKYVTPYKSPYCYYFEFVSPMGIFTSLGLLVISFFCLKISLFISKGNSRLQYFPIAVFVFISISYFSFGIRRGNPYYWLYMPLLLITFFISILNLKSFLSKFKILVKLGQNSFSIYLFHPLVLYLLLFLSDKTFLVHFPLLNLLVTHLTTIIICLFISMAILNSCLKKYILPRGLTDLKR